MMKKKKIAGILILLTVIAIPLFTHLDVMPIKQWDEGRFAVEAINMLRTHNWIVMYYNGAPDMWMLKPPLMMWLQAISMLLIGYNELAVRLPSALAGVGTCLLLYYLLVKKTGNITPAIITCLVLVTAPGYIMQHSTRTGECDSLLTMLITGSAISLYLYADGLRNKYLAATFVFFTLAVLTKGGQAIIFLPGLFLYVLYKKQLVHMLKQKTFYLSLAGMLFFDLGYYLLREHYNPGYITTVLNNEMLTRYSTVMDSHSGGPWAYVLLLTNQFFSYWYLPAIAGLITGLFHKDKAIRDLAIFCGIFSVSYLIILSNGKTQLVWYLVPLYPFLAILCGILLSAVFKVMNAPNEVMSQNVLPYIILLTVFFTPYVNICNIVLSDQPGELDQDRLNMQYYMQNTERVHDTNMNGTTFLEDGFNHDLEWYVLALKLEHRPFELASRVDLRGNEKVAAFLPDSRKFLETNYNFQLLSSYRNVSLYQLRGRKDKTSKLTEIK